MTDIEKVKNNELFVKAVKAAREMLPNAKLYAGLVDLFDEGYATLYIDKASWEECDAVGCAALSYYDYIEAGNFRQPLCVKVATPDCVRDSIDITNLEV